MAVLTVGMLRDMLANLDPDMPVRMGMDMDLNDSVNAVTITGDTLYFDNVTSGLTGVGGSVLFNAFA